MDAILFPGRLRPQGKRIASIGRRKNYLIKKYNIFNLLFYLIIRTSFVEIFFNFLSGFILYALKFNVKKFIFVVI